MVLIMCFIQPSFHWRTTVPNKRSVYYFEPIHLHSTQFKGSFKDQIVYFNIISITDVIGGLIKETTIGSTSLKLDPIMELDNNSLLQMNIENEDETLLGKLNFGCPKLKPVYSFLDYKINLNIDFIPIIAIDYSLSNVVGDESKKKFINDYIPVINHIRHVYKDISNFCLGFGFGAKTWSKQVRASDIFSLSRNLFDPTIKYNKIMKWFKDTESWVEKSFPVKLTPILEHVTRYANHEFEHHKGRNYYWLFYITPGVIDDAQETADFIHEIYDLPMTVNIIKLHNPSYVDTNDATLLLTEFNRK